MLHRRRRGRTVPVFLAGREPHDVARANFFDGAAFALHPPPTKRDEKSLAERVGMPCRPRVRLERDDRTSDSGWCLALERGVDAYVAREPIGGSFGGRLRTSTCDLQAVSPVFESALLTALQVISIMVGRQPALANSRCAASLCSAVDSTICETPRPVIAAMIALASVRPTPWHRDVGSTTMSWMTPAGEVLLDAM